MWRKKPSEACLEQFDTGTAQVVKIVNAELDLMGGANSKLTYSPRGFTVLRMVGLQGDW